MINITRDVAVAGLQRAAASVDSSFAYNSGLRGGKCDYVRDGKPSCIVGHVLAELGVPLDRLRRADQAFMGAGLGSSELLDELENDEIVNVVDPEVRSVLSEAQYLQDYGTPWHESVRRAVESI